VAITTRITNSSSRKRIVDAIGSIIVAEANDQVGFAVDDNDDPEPYRIHVYTHRVNPIERWTEAPDEYHEDARPIVSVAFERHDPERSRSTPTKKRQGPGRFFVDCFGYGKSKITQTGHTLADERATAQADWCSWLVESILMSAHWVVLGLTGIVGQRFIESVDRKVVVVGEQTVQHIACYRITLAVDYLEVSPQYADGLPLEGVDVNIQRQSDGLLLIAASY